MAASLLGRSAVTPTLGTQPRDDRRAIGRRRGLRLTQQLAAEFREARVRGGLRQEDVARALGVSRSWVSRMERERLTELSILRAATLAAVLGLELSLRVYPAGAPLRDTAQLALLERFDRCVSRMYRRTSEAPMPIRGDTRARDRLLEGPVAIGVEAETRPSDLQAIERAIALKQRDSGARRAILLVSATRRNRELIRAVLPQHRASFPLGTAEVMRALRSGRDPGGNGIVLL